MSTLNYSQCWEDTYLLKEALAITSSDTVLSITSGGDNTLALLLQKPQKIFSLDINPAQNYLAELKLQSPKVLAHRQYLELLGVLDSKMRGDYLNSVSTHLSEEARSWFGDNLTVIRDGIIHRGKFERYLNKFRKYLLPLVHTKQTVSEFINQTNLPDQINFYENVWYTWRWKLFFAVATNRALVRKYARQTGTTVNQPENSSYFSRLEQLIYRHHLKTNHYLCYALRGEYGESLPDYLLEKNYLALRNHDSTTCTAVNTLTKYNLSDAFEFLPPTEAAQTWQEIIRTAKNGARVVYWCNQQEHTPPAELRVHIVRDVATEERLSEQDRLYFYRSFHIYTITK
jgi:S-adenosylmethionine-diacylglycerol 3-amino-3-carboxypropyl transferase